MDKFDLEKKVIVFVSEHHAQDERGLNVKDIAYGIEAPWKNVADSMIDLQEKGFLILNKLDETHPVPEERGLYVKLSEEGVKLAQKLANE